MVEHIYLLGAGDALEPLHEAPYTSEAALQDLIARHPEVLAGEQMDQDAPRRWILVSREMGIGDGAEASNRWAVDHLLIDQDAVPTLVEVKRGSNPEIRRAIIGQMLEYAAHASAYWSIDRIRGAFEAAAVARGDAPPQLLATLLQLDAEPDVDRFWDEVATNLAARRMRLLFVADEIPNPLAQVVEFLNEQMPSVEVLAVELKQFQGAEVRTLVPRVIGRTTKRRSGGVTPSLTNESFLAQFPDGPVKDTVRRLLDEGRAAGASFEWGSRGVSIRGRCPAWSQPVTVAWFYPSSAGWMRTRYLSFGSGILDYPDLPVHLGNLLRRYGDRFKDDGFVEDASSQGVYAWSIRPERAAEHAELLVGRLREILGELRALPAEPA